MENQETAFRHSVKFVKLPSSGERSVLVVGPKGIALEHTTAYTMVHQRERGLSPNTMMNQMQSVAMLLDWLGMRGIDFDQRIGSCNLLDNAEIYALKDHLRGRLDGKSGVVSNAHYRNRCVSVREYIAWHAEMVISRIPNHDWRRAHAYREGLERFLGVMSSGLPPAREWNREGHSEEIQEIFLAAIVPGSPTNPFQKRFHKRNYALLLLYHEHGIRRSEALKIKGEHLNLHGDRPTIDIVFQNDDPDDPRVKEGRMKTLPRTLPISPELCAALKDWLADRRSFGTSRKTPFVFVTRDGDPIGAQEINRMFRLIRQRVPGLPADLTTHHKRHDMNDRITKLAKKLGWSEADEKRFRNAQNGWSKTSDQGEQYTKRSTREGAAEASLALQEMSRGDNNDRATTE